MTTCSASFTSPLRFGLLRNQCQQRKPQEQRADHARNAPYPRSTGRPATPIQPSLGRLLPIKHPQVLIALPFTAEALFGYERFSVLCKAVADDIRGLPLISSQY